MSIFITSWILWKCLASNFIKCLASNLNIKSFIKYVTPIKSLKLKVLIPMIKSLVTKNNF